MTHSIRPATRQDAPALATVQMASWRAAFRGVMTDEYLDGLDHEALTKAWEGLLADAGGPRAGTLAVERADGRGLVGYSRFHPTDDEDDDPTRVGMIGSLYTVPDVWSTGVGKALITAVLDAVASAGYAEASLWVLEGNTRARSFYERDGWRHDGAVVMDRTDRVPITKLRYRKALG
ncbi:GNAT family N-acetyltransferase [Nonomuraea sp. NPDC050691]|uniref:GNAT family N-acetyltransferase n=1 Tax=Nonomuraea sp. NPDC050691 TaxID=3155661 RepID=UPI0033F9F1CD